MYNYIVRIWRIRQKTLEEIIRMEMKAKKKKEKGGDNSPDNELS
jgi:hypothetical protein